MSERTAACVHCGEAFTYDTKTTRFQRYCSALCRNRAASVLRATRAGDERRCSRCREVKPIGEFSGRVIAYCRPCNATRARERRPLRTPEQRERERLRESARRSGLTVEALRNLLAAQRGLCAICKVDLGGVGGKWHADHDHSCCPVRSGRTGSSYRRTCGACVRGILCGQCNVGLGMFRDDPAVLAAAITYLTAGTGAATAQRAP